MELTTSTHYDLDLYDTTPMLVNLHYTVHWSSHSQTSAPNRRQIFSPMTFAALLPTESVQHFLTTLNQACLSRIRSATRFTFYSFTNPIDCQAEFNIIYASFPSSKLSIRNLTLTELTHQLELIKLRNYQDAVRVDMAIEIDITAERKQREINEMQLRGIAADCIHLLPKIENEKKSDSSSVFSDPDDICPVKRRRFTRDGE
ncbi:hypothetical protein QBC44DRAFT_373739 [Cladorrhinum sp. PSN332]|nr:hypothetical protein QBC44DRAFT_373739 [Cladorrhinum sp. PSN332]